MTMAKKFQLALAVLLTLAIAVGAAYVAGRTQGRHEGEPALAAATASLATCQENMRNRGLALDEAHSRISLLEARRRVARSGDELDARNFGTAETELRLAAGALGEIVGVGAQPNLETLREQLGAANVSVAADLNQQRNTIRDFAGQMDALLQPTQPTQAP